MLSTKQAENPGAVDNATIVVQLQTHPPILFFVILELRCANHTSPIQLALLSSAIGKFKERLEGRRREKEVALSFLLSLSVSTTLVATPGLVSDFF